MCESQCPDAVCNIEFDSDAARDRIPGDLRTSVSWDEEQGLPECLRILRGGVRRLRNSRRESDHGQDCLETPFQGRSVIAVASYWVSLGDPFHPEARERTLTLPGLPLRATGGGNQCINTRALQCPDVELV